MAVSANWRLPGENRGDFVIGQPFSPYPREKGGDTMEKNCRMVELRYKEVININDGSRLGFVGDVEICLPKGNVTAILVPGPCRFFGLFGRGEDYYIPWDCIRQIGDDIILVDQPFQRKEPFCQRKRGRCHL